jgi:hypothetical protein
MTQKSGGSLAFLTLERDIREMRVRSESNKNNHHVVEKKRISSHFVLFRGISRENDKTLARGPRAFPVRAFTKGITKERSQSSPTGRLLHHVALHIIQGIREPCHACVLRKRSSSKDYLNSIACYISASQLFHCRS